MHPLLCQNDQGEFKIRWWLLARSLILVVVIWFTIAFTVRHFSGRRLSIPSVLTFLIMVAAQFVVWLYFVKRRAEGKPLRQFSLAALFVAVTVACLWLGVASWQRQTDLAHLAKRRQLEKSLMDLVGNGTVHLGNPTTLIQVKRLSFNDDDLVKVVQLESELDAVGSPIGILDLTGTSVTDRGVSQLGTIKSLKYCFLTQTAITDTSLDALKTLPKLRILAVDSTRVTPPALLQLSIEQPQLDIRPTTYRQLKYESAQGSSKK